MSNNLSLKISQFKILAIAILTKVLASHTALADTSSTDYLFLLNNGQTQCQQIGKNYLEVRAFETENFYINICRNNNQYYYLGESKIGTKNTIFIPANFLSLGETYRAHNGNVAYIISILPHQAILTIERNGEQVAIESAKISQCNLHNNQSEYFSKISFKYSEQYLNSYAIIIPNQKLSLFNKVKVSSQSSILGFDYFKTFNTDNSLMLSSCS